MTWAICSTCDLVYVIEDDDDLGRVRWWRHPSTVGTLHLSDGSHADVHDSTCPGCSKATQEPWEPSSATRAGVSVLPGSRFDPRYVTAWRVVGGEIVRPDVTRSRGAGQ